MRHFLFIITISLIFTACNGRFGADSGIIPKDKFVEILADVHLADALISLNPKKSSQYLDSTNGNYNYVFKKHSITKLDFYRSVHYYAANPVVFDRMYDDVLEILNKREAALKKPSKEKLDSIKKSK